MSRNLVRYFFKRVNTLAVGRRLCSNANYAAAAAADEKAKLASSEPVKNELRNDTNVNEIKFEYIPEEHDIKKEALSTNFDAEYIDQIGKPFARTFNLAAYANQLPTIRKLIDLGVNLAKVERRREYAEFILKLDFDRHCKEHIRFLHDQGVPADQLGRFITYNPLIFNEQLENLNVRVKYLRQKKFSSDAIKQILIECPEWLNYSIIELDERLGFIQQEVGLSGDDMRSLIFRLPKLVTVPSMYIRLTKFAFVEEMGFNKRQFKEMMLKCPALLMKSHQKQVAKFDYLYNQVGISYVQFVLFPELFLAQMRKIKERAEYLKQLKRNQFNPDEAGYVPPVALGVGSDVDFCERYTKTTIDDYNYFLKSM